MLETAQETVDPVCGMTLDTGEAIQVVHEGNVYSFCDPACASIFSAEPTRWVDLAGEGGFEHEH